MFALLAAITAGLDFLLIGLGSHTNAWFSPTALLALAVGFLALHVLPVGPRIRQ